MTEPSIDFLGSWIHLQDPEFLTLHGQLSRQTVSMVRGFGVLSSKHRLVGHINAFLYSPELIRPFTEEDLIAYQDWLRVKRAAYGYIYSVAQYPFACNPQSRGGTLYLDLRKEEERLWQNLEGRCRTAIRKARSQGVRVEFENDKSVMLEWYALYKKLGTERGFSLHDSSYLLALQQVGWGRLATAWLDGRLLGGAFLLIRKHCVFLAAAFGVGKEYRGTSPGNLLLWESILRAKASGLVLFDFMGANDDPHHGPTVFKRSFGGDFVRIYEYVIPANRWKRRFFDLFQKARRLA